MPRGKLFTFISAASIAFLALLIPANGAPRARCQRQAGYYFTLLICRASGSARQSQRQRVR